MQAHALRQQPPSGGTSPPHVQSTITPPSTRSASRHRASCRSEWIAHPSAGVPARSQNVATEGLPCHELAGVHIIRPMMLCARRYKADGPASSSAAGLPLPVPEQPPLPAGLPPPPSQPPLPGGGCAGAPERVSLTCGAAMVLAAGMPSSYLPSFMQAAHRCHRRLVLHQAWRRCRRHLGHLRAWRPCHRRQARHRAWMQASRCRRRQAHHRSLAAAQCSHLFHRRPCLLLGWGIQAPTCRQVSVGCGACGCAVLCLLSRAGVLNCRSSPGLMLCSVAAARRPCAASRHSGTTIAAAARPSATQWLPGRPAAATQSRAGRGD